MLVKEFAEAKQKRVLCQHFHDFWLETRGNELVSVDVAIAIGVHGFEESPNVDVDVLDVCLLLLTILGGFHYLTENARNNICTVPYNTLRSTVQYAKPYSG